MYKWESVFLHGRGEESPRRTCCLNFKSGKVVQVKRKTGIRQPGSVHSDQLLFILSQSLSPNYALHHVMMLRGPPPPILVWPFDLQLPILHSH